MEKATRALANEIYTKARALAEQQQRANAATSAAEQEYGVTSGPRVTRQPPTPKGELREQR